MKLIIGLGNPGKKYEPTRHNVGFRIIDRVAPELNWKTDEKHQALTAKGEVEGTAVLLAKPTTFMNNSGAAVQALAAYYKVATDGILVIHDEMDLSPGRIAFIAKGGAAGHNGIADIQERLGSKEIARLRIGIGRPLPPIPTEDWVLQKPGAEKDSLQDAETRAIEAVRDWIKNGLLKAMNKWNTA